MTLKPEDIADLAAAIARRNAESSPAALRDRIAALEAENAALRIRLAHAQSQAPSKAPQSPKTTSLAPQPQETTSLAPAPATAPKRSHHKKVHAK